MLRILSHCSASDSDFAFLRTGATHSILSPLIERSRVIKTDKHKFSQADFRQMYPYFHRLLTLYELYRYISNFNISEDHYCSDF